MRYYMGAERIDLFEPNVMIAMKVSIEGNAEDKEIERAIYNAIDSNEILNTKVVLEEDGKVYYENISKQNNKVIISNESWQEVFNKQKKIRFEIENGEFVRAFILNNGSKKQILVLAHHLAGDGKSIVYFIQDIMKSLSEKELTFKKVTLLPPDKLPEKSEIPKAYIRHAEYYNDLWKRNKKVFSTKDYEKVHKTYWNTHNTVVITEHFSKEELKKLIHKTKNTEVTLTSYIITQFIKLMQDIDLVGLAVNGRLDDNCNMGNQTTVIKFNCKYNNENRFEENARCVQIEMKKKLQDFMQKFCILQFIESLDSNLVYSVFAYMSGLYDNEVSRELADELGYNKNDKKLSISNLTKLDIEIQYGEYKISDFVFIPPIVFYATRLLGIATLGDEMNITYNIIDNENLDKEKSYFKMVMDELKK